jgi:hypothetical protein
MGQRDAPAAPHPAPADDWILGSDGHWRPPPLTEIGPQRGLERTIVVHEDAPPVPHKVGAGTIIAVMVVIAAVAALAWVALLA